MLESEGMRTTLVPLPGRLEARAGAFRRGPEAARRVLGGQGQLWTEYIATRDRLDYMAYPRAIALSEVL